MEPPSARHRGAPAERRGLDVDALDDLRGDRTPRGGPPCV